MHPRQSSAPMFAVMTFVLALVTTARGAGREQVLHTFLGKPAEYSLAALMFDKQGNLYGTTAEGDRSNGGVIFELTPKPGGGWTYSVLYRFKGGKDGSYPQGALIQDAAGNLYGTTQSGGGSSACEGGCGTVFELSPSSGGWNKTVLYSFDGSSGAWPRAGLVMDSDGNLYGTTFYGGPGTCYGYYGECGTVFELAPTGGGWTEHVLYNFQGQDKGDGSGPLDKLVFDAAGNLYGTTFYGGTESAGTVFELTPSDSGWKEEVLHTFTGAKDGGAPNGELTFDMAGNLYGTTELGGDLKCGCGTVFELTPTSKAWKERVIHKFHNGKDGSNLLGGVVFDANGNLYGATVNGGASGYGTVFEMTPGSGDHWTLTPLYSFHGGRDGGIPYVGVILDAVGNLYGTTYRYGKDGCGVVFEVKR
jgi:uncharacterized repeat protein (TIGR03803 family)